MWELIRANRRKSFLLFIGMGILLFLIGAIVGEALLGEGGSVYGFFFAGILWFILSLVSYFSGSSILLSISKAKEVTKEMHPRLFNVVEEMSIAASLPKMPKVYIINEAAPNAFATGKNPENCAVAVTAGLLAKLNRDELQGVIAHEISHILNRDVAFMSYAGVMLGAIVLISEIFLHGLWFSGGSRRYSSKDSGGGQAQMIMMVLSIVLAILAPIMARLLYFAISRKREYLADASGARLTRYPEGLASALEKISDNKFDLKSANKVTAGMYIANPLKKKGMKLSNLSSTHPPIDERIRILRNMTHGASLLDYQQSYNSAKGSNSTLIPKSHLKKEEVKIKESAAKESKKDKRKEARDLGDLMMNLNQYVFLSCACGLKMKLPPDYKSDAVVCPKCGKKNEIDMEQLSEFSKKLSSNS